MNIVTPIPLADQLAVIDQTRPGWHAWASNEGRLYAVHTFSIGEMHDHDAEHRWSGPRLGPGITLHAETVLLLDMAIDRYEGTCARPGCTHDHGSHWDGTGACGFCGCGSYVLADAA